MSGFILEDLDMQTYPMLYDLAAYFGLKDRSERIENKQALMDVYNWALDNAKSPTSSDLISAVRKMERKVGFNSQESRLATIRRETLMETMDSPEPTKSSTRPREKKETVDEPKAKTVEKVEAKPEEPKEEAPSFIEQFRQGIEEYAKS